MTYRLDKFSIKSLFSLFLLLLALVLAGMTAAELIKIYGGEEQGALQSQAVANDMEISREKAVAQDHADIGIFKSIMKEG